LNYKPKRINKAIELWEDGQPIYYGGSGLGSGVDSYAQGIRMSQTYMDAINVEMEHGCLDLMGLRDFMRGLVAGGPTRSGHRTPSVFVETGIIGLDADYARANSWLLEQFLDAGVHGIHICHARRWEALEVSTQMAMRYPFERAGITVADNDAPSTSRSPSTGTALAYRGLRGSSASYAAEIWGVNGAKYCHLADLWPLNPQGEIICGLKIEDTFADEDVANTIALPGISMAEWGPGDHSYWLYGLEIMPEDGSRPADVEARPEMRKVRQAVLDNCKKNKVMFLNAGSTDPNNLAYVITQIKDGAMVLEAGEQAAIIGREYTKRKMPV
jgi:4-hydroxy-2-oxoheptanedioate aldolase